MARGAPPSGGFQLTLPDSAQFSSPADKAQNNQQDNGQQNNSGGQNNAQQQSVQHSNTPQHQTKSHAQAADTQNTTPPGAGNDQQHQAMTPWNNNTNQQAVMAAGGAAHYGQQAMTPSSGHKNEHMAQGYHAINQQVAQPALGQTSMVSSTPSGQNQQQQAMMSSSPGTSQQVGQGHNGNHYQHSQAFNVQGIAGQGTPGYQQNQAVVAQSPMANQQMHFTPSGMHRNEYKPPVGPGLGPSNPQHVQNTLGHNIMAAGSATAHQYGQGFMATSNLSQFPQSNMGNPLFHQQQQNLVMPDSLPLFQSGTGYMPNNNMLGQQCTMGLTTGTEQFQSMSDFEKIIQEMCAKSLHLQMGNQTNQMPQQQPATSPTVNAALNQYNNGQSQTCTPMNQLTGVPNQVSNQNANGSMAA